MRRMFVILALEVEESLVQGQPGLTMSPYLNHKTHLKKKMQERKEKELHLSLAWDTYWVIPFLSTFALVFDSIYTEMF